MKNIKYSYLIILCVLLYACTGLVSTKGLVAYYTFNGNAVDESKNGNDGKVIGPVLTNDRNGKINSAYSFNGIDDHIHVSDAENLRITGQITMSAWFKTDYALPFAGIICKAEPYEPQHGYLICINDHNRVRADVIYDHSKGVNGVLSSTNVLVDDKWHHVVATYDGKECRLFIDGKLDKKMTYDKGLKTNTEPLLIGWDKCNYLSHRHFKGLIDDIRIFNRSLSKKEIVRLYKEN